MTNAELITSVATALNTSQVKSTDIVRAVFSAVQEGVLADGTCRTPIGIFKTTERAARPAHTGRNPRTGEPLEIAAKAASKAVSFKASSSFKEELN